MGPIVYHVTLLRASAFLVAVNQAMASGHRILRVNVVWAVCSVIWTQTRVCLTVFLASSRRQTTFATSVIPTATAAPIMGPASVTWDSAMQDILTLLHHRLVLSVVATALRVVVRQINVASVQWDTLWTAVLCAMYVHLGVRAVT